jgi:hypothetical protein
LVAAADRTTAQRLGAALELTPPVSGKMSPL